MILRADDARIACPLFQAEYGGEVPTSALQLRIVKVSSKTAKTLNELWHSRLPKIENWRMCELCFAAECNNVFYAVALWSNPVNRNLHEQGCFELRRMAIAPDAPRFTASRMLAVMRKMIVAEKPELKRLISYQDTEVHTGTIYKAAGWINAGNNHQGGKCGWDNNVRARAEHNGKNPLLAPKNRWEYKLTETPEKPQAESEDVTP